MMQRYNLHKDLAQMLVRAGGEEILLMPLDWGAAREADKLMRYLGELCGKSHRYDLEIGSSGRGGIRQVLNDPKEVVDDLRNGRYKMITSSGYLTIKGKPIDTEDKRLIVPFEDYVMGTGAGLSGGVEFCESIKHLLNGYVLPAAVIANRAIRGQYGLLADPLDGRSLVYTPSIKRSRSKQRSIGGVVV